MSKPLAIGPHALMPSRLPRYPGVYLLCFDVPYVSPNGRAVRRHYIGWAHNLRERVQHHAVGRGARFLAVVRAAGVSWTVTHLWLDASRIDERRLKDQHHAWRLCPRCNLALRRPGAGH